MIVPRYFVSQLTAILTLLLPIADGNAGEILRIGSDDWCPFVCASGDSITGGYLVDLSAEALALSGYQVVPVLMPLKRAMTETLDNHIQGVYAPPIDQRLQSSEALIYSRACFYTRPETNWTFDGYASLQNITIGIVEDYGYDDGIMDAYILKNSGKAERLDIARGENAGLHNLQKLLARRFPVLLEHEAVMTHLLKQTDAHPKIRQTSCLSQSLPLTLGFNQHQMNSENWLKALHEGLLHLQQTGETEKLQRRYGISPALNSK